MRITIKSCPHCHRVLDVTTNRFAQGPLGPPGFFPCPKCGGRISRGQREWSQFTLLDRVLYLAWISLSVLVLGTTASVVAYVMARNWLGLRDGAAAVGLFAFAGVGALYVVSTRSRIEESRQRESNALVEGEAEAAFGPLKAALSDAIDAVGPMSQRPEASRSSQEGETSFTRASICAAYCGVLLVARARGVLRDQEALQLRYLVLDGLVKYSIVLPNSLKGQHVPKSYVRAATQEHRKSLVGPLLQLERTVFSTGSVVSARALAMRIAQEYQLVDQVDQLTRIVDEVSERAALA